MSFLGRVAAAFNEDTRNTRIGVYSDLARLKFRQLRHKGPEEFVSLNGPIYTIISGMFARYNLTTL